MKPMGPPQSLEDRNILNSRGDAPVGFNGTHDLNVSHVCSAESPMSGAMNMVVPVRLLSTPSLPIRHQAVEQWLQPTCSVKLDLFDLEQKYARKYSSMRLGR